MVNELHQRQIIKQNMSSILKCNNFLSDFTYLPAEDYQDLFPPGSGGLTHKKFTPNYIC